MNCLLNLLVIIIFFAPFIILEVYILWTLTMSSVIVPTEKYLSKHSQKELNKLKKIKEELGIIVESNDILLVQKAYLLRLKKQTSALYILLVALVSFIISNLDFFNNGTITLFSTFWWGIFVGITIIFQSTFIIPKIEERVFLIDCLIEKMRI
ncbi:hypothetical protein [Streptococcus suis]|uniref:hypothetical protein n=1 Tax=Streptococcus suis TaxID=1307 RepID=UPI001862E787|nr:hypothetical protein [Streptococcus suis]QGJ86026.1 hypothetical protein [Streptococcus phage phi-SsuHCJ31_comEC]